MNIEIRGSTDEDLEQIKVALTPYVKEHADAEIAIYRQNAVSIRIRVIDPSFKGVSKADRHDRLWSLIEPLPEEIVSEISILILLTPTETKSSLMNLEFEDPSPSLL